MTIPGLYLIGGPPRVVAVSKRQPVEKIQAVYEEGIRHFGENYVSITRLWFNIKNINMYILHVHVSLIDLHAFRS